ncbi:hypothetical protein BRM9_0853 [Methanobacterium formicicum]|uniref:Uncharacterized protein n=1 Tax=Methanobacterium formicicum TaxID=2162 RepID=A0A089ZFE2_METFO|nr:hypothetical protein [Methanobacterium formicicum]AIS31670.1 hypothetical protein BRM9_0853 [Methanobacterium formicicum]
MTDKNNSTERTGENLKSLPFFSNTLDETDKNVLEIEKSAEILYNEIKRQDKLVMSSFDSLNNKANGIIVSCGTLITLITLAIIQLLNSKVMDTFFLMHTLVFFLFLPYVFLIISIVLSIKSYYIKDLKTFNAEKLLEEYYRNHKVKIMDILSSNLASYIEKNKEESKKQKNL